MFFKVLFVVCLLTIASSTKDTADVGLQKLLKAFLERTINKKHICDTKNCGDGQCGGGEDPHDWGENYYCFGCKVNGGFKCQIPDPCHVEDESGESNPCRGEQKRIYCRNTAYDDKKGYYCSKYERSLVTRLLEEIDESNEAEAMEIRSFIAKYRGPAEGVAHYVRSLMD